MTILFYLFIAIFGLILGSFLNCLIWRLHKEETLWNRSYCPQCKAKIHWYDNMPILSFFLLGTKCRYCHQKISWQYPIVELLTPILLLFVFYFHTRGFLEYSFLEQLLELKIVLVIIRDWILALVLTIIFVMDLRWYVIVDKVSLPAAIIVLILNLCLGMSWQSLSISAIIGAGFFLLQFLISSGKWIGGGDIRLGLLMGLALGWPHILVAMFLSYLLGAITGLGLMIAGKKKFGSKLPFGTFLTIATLITLFWGQELIAWYFNIFTVF